MENNKQIYEAEHRAATNKIKLQNKKQELSNKINSLEKQLADKEEKLKKQELLLEEMYKLIYYKRAWLTLSDDNIKGMQKVVKNMPLGQDGYPTVTPKTSEEYKKSEGYDENDPWGV